LVLLLVWFFSVTMVVEKMRRRWLAKWSHGGLASVTATFLLLLRQPHMLLDSWSLGTFFDDISPASFLGG
jgi:hypothetical protein